MSLLPDKTKKAKHGKHAKPADPDLVIPEVAEEPAKEEAKESVEQKKTVELTVPEIPKPVTEPAEETADADSGQGEFAAASSPLLDQALIESAKKKKLRKKVAAIVAAVIAGLLVVSYGAGVFFFFGKFFPNTVIGEIDISMKSQEDLERLLEDATKDYSIRVTGEDFSLPITGAQVNFQFDAKEQAQSFISQVNAWAWPVEVFKTHDVSRDLEATCDASSVDAIVKEAVAKHNETGRPTEDATIGFNKEKHCIDVTPEKYGTKIEPDVLSASVVKAIDTAQRSYTLANTDLEQPKIYASDKRIIDAAQKANDMLSADITLKLGDIDAAHITGEQSVEWIKMSDGFTVSMDKEAMNKWIEETAKSFETVGSKRTWTRPDGKECEVTGGDYGWGVDHSALIEMITKDMEAGATVTENVPVSSQGATYAGPGKRDWGKRYVDVDLSTQHAVFYDDNDQVIWESDIVTGSPGKNATPEGVYDINGKESPSKLVGYENGVKTYETMVSKWMPFIKNEIGFHDANWQPGFGGNRYRNGYGSHGCVNLPVSKANELYQIIQKGDVVVVHW